MPAAKRYQVESYNEQSDSWVYADETNSRSVANHLVGQFKGSGTMARIIDTKTAAYIKGR